MLIEKNAGKQNLCC